MIIGVCGFAGSGKDTVADEICKDPAFVKLAFADNLKRILMGLFDFSYEQLWGPSATRSEPDKRYPRKGGFLTPRHALQSLGTEWGRDCYENLWIDLAIKDAKRLEGSHSLGYSQTDGVFLKRPGISIRGVVITDCRFRNELEGVRSAGGKLVRVLRKGLDAPPYGHSSETEQAGIPDGFFDYVFHNDGSLEDFPPKCAAMLKELAQ
jgi:hypothetical protein